MDGQAADAISAYTQIKMEDVPRLLRIPKSECPDIWIRLPRHKWTQSWSNIEDLVVPLERNLYIHPLAGLLWDMVISWPDCYGKDSLRKFYWSLDGKKYQIKSVCLFIENKDYSFRYTWMIPKWLENSRI